ncbi:AraC family transcriptional regulator [Bacillus pseudomycoides]|uniref:AraC family transcriptional regulator n=1 Tax=Bacillus pseudomycoides TaxID=64104 RepID=UPI003D24961C
MNKAIDIQYLCHLIYQTFSIPVHFLSTNNDILYEFISNDRCSPFYSSKKEQLNDLYQKNDPYNFPLIQTNRYLENFVLIHIVDHEYMEGTLIIAPSAYPRLSEDMVIELMNEFAHNCNKG